MVTIYSSVDQLSDPSISSVTFSSDGTMLLISFDSTANYGAGAVAAPFSQFQCDELLLFVGAQYAACKWTSDRSIVDVIGGSKPAPSVRDTVVLLSSVLRPAVQIVTSGIIASIAI